MPKRPLLRVLLQFWDHFITDTFVTLVLKSGLRLSLGPTEMVFKGYSVFGLISYCNPHCKFNCKFRPWRSWAIMLKFFMADQCTKRLNKNCQPTCLDVFDKNWHALAWHVRPPPLPEYVCMCVRTSPSIFLFFFVIGAPISIGQEIRCLPYTFLFILHRVFCSRKYFFCTQKFEMLCIFPDKWSFRWWTILSAKMWLARIGYKNTTICSSPSLYTPIYCYYSFVDLTDWVNFACYSLVWNVSKFYMSLLEHAQAIHLVSIDKEPFIEVWYHETSSTKIFNLGLLNLICQVRS